MKINDIVYFVPDADYPTTVVRVRIVSISISGVPGVVVSLLGKNCNMTVDWHELFETKIDVAVHLSAIKNEEVERVQKWYRKVFDKLCKIEE